MLVGAAGAKICPTRPCKALGSSAGPKHELDHGMCCACGIDIVDVCTVPDPGNPEAVLLLNEAPVHGNGWHTKQV
jgi:hypothetical protein